MPLRRSPHLVWIVVAACTTAPESVAPLEVAVEAPRTEPAVDAAALVVSQPRCPVRPRVEAQRDLDEFRGLEVSSDGRWVAVRRGGLVVLIDRASGTQVASVAGLQGVFTPDGEQLLVARAREIERRSLPSLALVGRLPSPTKLSIGALVVDADGRRVVASAARGYYHVWDLATGERRCSGVAGEGGSLVALGGQRAWACEPGRMVERNLDTCTVTRSWPGRAWSACKALAVDPAGERVAVSGLAQGLQLLDTGTGAWLPHYVASMNYGDGEIRALPDGDFLLADDARVRRFEVRRPKPASRFTGIEAPERIHSSAISADGRILMLRYVPTYGELAEPGPPLEAWSLREARSLGRLGDSPRLLEPRSVAPHGQTFLTWRGLYSTVLLKRISGDDFVGSSFSGDGARIFGVSGREVRVYDGHTGALLAHNDDVPDKGRLTVDKKGDHAVVVNERAAVLYSVDEGSRTALRKYGETRHVEAEFSPDGEWLMVWDDGLTLWSVRKKKRVRRFGGPTVEFGEDPFSADGRRVAVIESGEGREEGRVLDVPAGTVRRRVPGAIDLVLSGDGERFAVIGDAGEMTIRAVADGRVVHHLPVRHRGRLRVDADGHLEVLTSTEVETWSFATGERLAVAPASRYEPSARLRDGVRIVPSHQLLTIYGADGARIGGAVLAERGVRASFSADGAWDGDPSLLGFSTDLTPCLPTDAPQPDLWSSLLARMGATSRSGPVQKDTRSDERAPLDLRPVGAEERDSLVSDLPAD